MKALAEKYMDTKFWPNQINRIQTLFLGIDQIPKDLDLALDPAGDEVRVGQLSLSETSNFVFVY